MNDNIQNINKYTPIINNNRSILNKYTPIINKYQIACRHVTRDKLVSNHTFLRHELTASK